MSIWDEIARLQNEENWRKYRAEQLRKEHRRPPDKDEQERLRQYREQLNRQGQAGNRYYPFGNTGPYNDLGMAGEALAEAMRIKREREWQKKQQEWKKQDDDDLQRHGPYQYYTGRKPDQQPYTKNGIVYNTWTQLIKKGEPVPDRIDPDRAANFLRQEKYPLRPDRMQWRLVETVWSSIISHLGQTYYDIQEAI